MAITRLRNERGVSLVEAALTIPMLLLIAVGIFEFGRAYQFWQVLTNAAREGARFSVTPGATEGQTQSVVVNYMNMGGVTGCDASCVGVNRGLVLPSGGSGSSITIAYPFQFIVLQPVANLIRGGSADSRLDALTMQATATMRNEAP